MYLALCSCCQEDAAGGRSEPGAARVYLIAPRVLACFEPDCTALIVAPRQVLFVDLDVHHGDGTASIFAGDPSVFTWSVHCDDQVKGLSISPCPPQHVAHLTATGSYLTPPDGPAGIPSGPTSERSGYWTAGKNRRLRISFRQAAAASMSPRSADRWRFRLR